MIERPFNFAAGPAVIPNAVLEKAKDELLFWNNTGGSPMEIGHRTPEFEALVKRMEADIKALLNVPNNYRVLFLHGGAQAQFAMLPMNLLGNKTQADYVDTGIWSNKAYKEAEKYCTVNLAATLNKGETLSIPAQSDWQLSNEAAYVYYTSNETISGVEFHWTPKTGDIPLVCDMTSSIMSRPIDVSAYGVIFAGAQKNLGIAGLGIVIVRDDLLDRATSITPSVFSYAEQAAQSSLYNTPPVYACYMTSLFCKWIAEAGGVAALEAVNIRKSDKLYALTDPKGFYTNNIHPTCRSRMNVTFTLPSEALEKAFLTEAKAAGLLNLKGHRSVGGVRASIYNAMPEAGVDALVTLMKDFEKRNG